MSGPPGERTSAATTMTSVGADSAPSAPERSVAVGVVTPPRADPGAERIAPRRRPRGSISVGAVARGAPEEVLLQPAGEVLGGVAWSGASPDPDVLDAVTFLAWL